MRKFAIEIKYALIFTLVMLAWSIGEKEMGFHDEKIAHYLMASWASGPVAFLIYFLSIREKKKEYFGNQMTFAQGFVSGLYLSFFIAMLSPVAQFVLTRYISPEFLDNLVAYTTSKGRMSQEEARSYFSLNSQIMQAVSSAMSLGLLSGAVIAFFLKTKTQPGKP